MKPCQDLRLQQVDIMTRRPWILGSLISYLSTSSLFAFWKQVRTPLPGGGSVVLPSGYKATMAGEYNHNPEIDALIAHRKYRSTLAGSYECDGMIAVARSSAYADLAKFVQNARAGLTTSWSYADLKPGWFGGKHEQYPLQTREGSDGPEMERELRVHVVGFWDVYDKPARQFAVRHKSGLMIAVWIFDSHGGINRARKIAQDLAASFAP